MENLSSTLLKRETLLEELQEAGRAHSTATIMFHAAMAAHFGLSATDWKCADILERAGPISAGQLAELTGLTTGAVTGLIDRLEKACFARREPDPNDRRRVIIWPMPGDETKITELFTSLLATVDAVTADYSDEELALIVDFMKRAGQMMQQEAVKLRAQTGGG
jgi:DNA-binding MarR family transcriptional regulator